MCANHKLVGIEASSTLSAGVIASVDKPDGGGTIWEHPIGVSFENPRALVNTDFNRTNGRRN